MLCEEVKQSTTTTTTKTTTATDSVGGVTHVNATIQKSVRTTTSTETLVALVEDEGEDDDSLKSPSNAIPIEAAKAGKSKKKNKKKKKKSNSSTTIDSVAEPASIAVVVTKEVVSEETKDSTDPSTGQSVHESVIITTTETCQIENSGQAEEEVVSTQRMVQVESCCEHTTCEYEVSKEGPAILAQMDSEVSSINDMVDGFNQQQSRLQFSAAVRDLMNGMHALPRIIEIPAEEGDDEDNLRALQELVQGHISRSSSQMMLEENMDEFEDVDLESTVIANSSDALNETSPSGLSFERDLGDDDVNDEAENDEAENDEDLKVNDYRSYLSKINEAIGSSQESNLVEFTDELLQFVAETQDDDIDMAAERLRQRFEERQAVAIQAARQRHQDAVHAFQRDLQSKTNEENQETQGLLHVQSSQDVGSKAVEETANAKLGRNASVISEDSSAEEAPPSESEEITEEMIMDIFNKRQELLKKYDEIEELKARMAELYELKRSLDEQREQIMVGVTAFGSNANNDTVANVNVVEEEDEEDGWVDEDEDEENPAAMQETDGPKEDMTSIISELRKVDNMLRVIGHVEEMPNPSEEQQGTENEMVSDDAIGDAVTQIMSKILTSTIQQRVEAQKAGHSSKDLEVVEETEPAEQATVESADDSDGQYASLLEQNHNLHEQLTRIRGLQERQDELFSRMTAKLDNVLEENVESPVVPPPTVTLSEIDAEDAVAGGAPVELAAPPSKVYRSGRYTCDFSEDDVVEEESPRKKAETASKIMSGEDPAGSASSLGLAHLLVNVEQSIENALDNFAELQELMKEVKNEEQLQVFAGLAEQLSEQLKELWAHRETLISHLRMEREQGVEKEINDTEMGEVEASGEEESPASPVALNASTQHSTQLKDVSTQASPSFHQSRQSLPPPPPEFESKLPEYFLKRESQRSRPIPGSDSNLADILSMQKKDEEQETKWSQQALMNEESAWVEPAEVNEVNVDQESSQKFQQHRFEDRSRAVSGEHQKRLFDHVKDEVYRHAASVISMFESEPYSLLQTLRGLQQLDTPYLRQRLLIALDEILIEKAEIDEMAQSPKPVTSKKSEIRPEESERIADVLRRMEQVEPESTFDADDIDISSSFSQSGPLATNIKNQVYDYVQTILTEPRFASERVTEEQISSIKMYLASLVYAQLDTSSLDMSELGSNASPRMKSLYESRGDQRAAGRAAQDSNRMNADEFVRRLLENFEGLLEEHLDSYVGAPLKGSAKQGVVRAIKNECFTLVVSAISNAADQVATLEESMDYRRNTEVVSESESPRGVPRWQWSAISRSDDRDYESAKDGLGIESRSPGVRREQMSPMDISPRVNPRSNLATRTNRFSAWFPPSPSPKTSVSSLNSSSLAHYGSVRGKTGRSSISTSPEPRTYGLVRRATERLNVEDQSRGRLPYRSMDHDGAYNTNSGRRSGNVDREEDPMIVVKGSRMPSDNETIVGNRHQGLLGSVNKRHSLASNSDASTTSTVKATVSSRQLQHHQQQRKDFYRVLSRNGDSSGVDSKR